MATVGSRGTGTPVTSGTTWANLPNAVDGALGSNPNTYCTWVNATSGGTGYIEITGHGFAATIGAADTLNSVTLNIRHNVSSVSRISQVRTQAYVGATPVGTAYNSPTNVSTQTYTTTLTGLTLAHVRDATFKIRVTITRAAVTQSSTWSFDHAEIVCDYTPPQPSITQAAYQFFDEGTESGATSHGRSEHSHHC